MSSLEKRHSSRRGSTQSHRKYSNGFNDTSNVGMDETDREVSNLTDRAFRSLCIGEEAIYNDSEISSPTERHKAFADEAQQKDVLKANCQETIAYGVQYGGAERTSEVTSTFQHSHVDIAQEQVLQEEHLSYTSNGSIDSTWQQKRSTSRVSSLIKAFSSREGNYDNGTPNAVLLRDKYRDFNNESWDRSALLNFQKELSEFSSAYHQKSGPFQSYRNHFHASAAAVTRTDTTASLMKSSKSKFKALNSTNFFFHSEFSPFQLWKDYNRFPFGKEQTPGFVSSSEFPRWYDSPLYKELTATPRISSPPSESKRFNRRKIEDVVSAQRSKSTVIQKASAVEKRCESEMAADCPPWRRNYNFVKNKLPGNRPSTVSPTNEKSYRPDSSLLSHSKITYEIQHKVEKVADSKTSSSAVPFNISQLLTPVIHGRQETETSEILQFAHTPSVPDCSVQGDADLKPLPDVQQLRDSYKSKASSLLFNLKDNRKRVKSTYTPTTFKGLEVTDRNKQPSKLDDIESRLSDTSVSQMTGQEYSAVPRPWDSCNLGQQTYEFPSSKNVEQKEYTDGSHDNVILASQYRTANYMIAYGGPQGNSLQPEKLFNHQSEEHKVIPHMLSAQDVGTRNLEGHIYDPSRTLSYTRPEIENIPTKALPPAHSLSAQVSEKQAFTRGEDVVDPDLKERKFFDRKPALGYTKTLVNEKPSWENPGPVNVQTNNEILKNNMITPPFKGEIAALIEMDKQRKATAKQYLPSANDSHKMEKDTYLNKINDKIKQGRLEKEDEVQDTEFSSQKYPYTGFQNRPMQNNPTNTLSTSQKLYGYQMNRNRIEEWKSPPNESNLKARGTEIRNEKHDHVGLQRDTKYTAHDVTAERNYSHRRWSPTLEEKCQKNEGSVAYQPYKYESNKQWCITATDNKQTKDEFVPLRELRQTEDPDKTNAVYPTSRASYNNQQSALYTRTTQQRLNAEDGVRIVEHKQNDTIVPNQTKPNMKSDLTRPNIQNTEQTHISSQNREDRFSINDILSMRDNQQAKRVKESKPSLSTNDTAPTKSENQTSFVMSDLAEGKAAEMDASKVRQQVPRDPTSVGNTDISSGYITKEIHNPTERSVNTGPGMKDKSGQDAMGKDNDKITLRALSYKERGQTKQEILTSKLKAHAQKEISAIKEKELAKQGIMSRNTSKQSTVVNNEMGQMNQDVSSTKKEITAEKLNHLFQDITYSSVTSYKEQGTNYKDGPRFDSLSAEEMKLSRRPKGSQVEAVSSYKNNNTVKDNEHSPNEKESAKIHSPSQGIQAQDEKLTVVERKIWDIQKNSKMYIQHPQLSSTDIQSTDIQKVSLVTGRDDPASGGLKTPSKAESIVKTEEPTSGNLPTLHTAYPTEQPTSAPKEKVSPRYDLSEKTETSKLTTYNNTKQSIHLDYMNKATELPSNVKNMDKLNSNSGKPAQKYSDLEEVVREKSPPDNTFTGKAPTAASGVKHSNIEAGLHTKHSVNATEEVGLKHGSHVSGNQDINSAKEKSQIPVNLVHDKNTPEAKEKQEWSAKQDINMQTSTSSAKELQHTDKIKSPENNDKNKGVENQTSNPQKLEKINLISLEFQQRSSLTEQTLHSEEDEQKVLQSKREIKDANHSTPLMRTDTVTESNIYSLQQENDRHSDVKYQTEKEKDLQKHIELSPKENNPESETTETRINKYTSNPTITENSPEKTYTLDTNAKDQQMSSHTASDKSAGTSGPVPESHIIHISSKEDMTSTDEPVIYSICVTTKSDAISEEEPVIYTISVSSASDVPTTDDPCQDKASLDQKQLSIDGKQNDEELTSSKNGKAGEVPRSKSNESDGIDTKIHLKNNKIEKTPAVRSDSTLAKDTHDNCRSNEVDNNNSPYESLLAKYGFQVKDNVDLKKEQDKMQRQEKEEPKNHSQVDHKITTDKHESAEKIKVDISTRHYEESSKLKPTEKPSELLTDEGKRRHYIPHSRKEHFGADGGSPQKSVGITDSSDKHRSDKHEDKKQRFENLTLKSEQGFPAKQNITISKPVPPSDDSPGNHSAAVLKEKITSDSAQPKENKQVTMQTMDTATEIKKDIVWDKSTDITAVECKMHNHTTDNQKMNHSATKSISNSTTAVDGTTKELKSKTSVMVAEDNKISEPKRKEIDQCYNKVQGKDAVVHTSRQSADTPLVNNQKIVNETLRIKDSKLQLSTEKEHETNTAKIETLTNKSAPTNGNRTECVTEEAEQDKFRRSNDSKNKTEIVSQDEITSITKKQIVKDNSVLSRNLIRNAATAGEMDKSPRKLSNILMEDKKAHQKEYDLNKDRVKFQNSHVSQSVPIKMDSASDKGIVLPMSENESEGDLRQLTNQNLKGVSEPRESENLKGKVTGVNTDNVKKASLVKVGKDTECASNKKGNALKEGSAQSQEVRQDVSDKTARDKVGKDGEQTKMKYGALEVKDSNANSKDTSAVKHEDRINVYQYHPGKGFLPETKGNTHEEQSLVGSKSQDVVPKKKEGNVTMPVLTHQGKKTTRPEISALADYARLRVISAEDDTSEKELLQNLDRYHKYNLSTGDPRKSLQVSPPMVVATKEPSREVNANRKHENQSTNSMRVQQKESLLPEKSKITEVVHERGEQHARGEVIAHPKFSSPGKSSGDMRVFADKETRNDRENTLTNLVQANAKMSSTEQRHGHPRSHEIHQAQRPQVAQPLLSHVDGKTDAKFRHQVHSRVLEKDSNVQNQEPLPSVGSKLNKTNEQVANAMNENKTENNAGEIEELEYYTVSAFESESKPKDLDKMDSLSSQTAIKKEVPEATTRGSQSNSSSPAMGKPNMFRVKNNTIRNSPITKTVKPMFHRSFSEEFLSPKEIWSGSLKTDIQHDHEYEAKETAKTPIMQEPTVASYRLPRAKEVQSQSLCSAESSTSAKELRSSHRRSQQFEDDEIRSVISNMSEDVESIAGSSVVMTDNMASFFEAKNNRDTYSRPASACYDRPPSSCYERPESACSDIRSLGKPPSVPPKTEKALRRAKRLTTRRTLKAESKTTSDSQGEVEAKSLRSVCSLPSSPIELMSKHRVVHAPPPVTHYQVEQNYTPSAPSIAAHPFPITQRKLLQDPNSGQYFMVDMPVQVKTKTFFDPETGKYVQLNVRQRAHSALTQAQPVEVLNHPYVVYSGFLPMSVSTIPTLRSSSQMSAPATMRDDEKKTESKREPLKQESYQPNYRRNYIQKYNDHVHGTHEQSNQDSLHTGNNVNNPSRQTDIITMSELEDFAMESA